MNFPSFLFFLPRRLVTFFKFKPRFCILVSDIYSTSCTSVLRYTALIYEDVIFTYVCRLLFYTIYRDKAQNNNDMRHETVWLDHTIDHTFHQNGSDGTRSNSSSYDWKVWLWISLFPPFCFASLLLLLTPITTFRSNIVRSIIIGHTS